MLASPAPSVRPHSPARWCVHMEISRLMRLTHNPPCELLERRGFYLPVRVSSKR